MFNRVALIVMVLVTSSSVCRSATQASITIGGTVPEITDITLTPEPGSDALSITSGATDQKVATIRQRSNMPRGFTVTLKSQNAGTGSQAALKPSVAVNAGGVDYVMKYDGMTVNLAGGGAVVLKGNGRTGPQGVATSLTVTFAPHPGIAADTYSDKITLTIAAN